MNMPAKKLEPAAVLTGAPAAVVKLMPRRLPVAETYIKAARQTAVRGRKQIHLTAKEFSMLRLMAEVSGEPVSREKFLDVVWGYNAFPTTRTVDNHIASLRSKIERDPDEPRAFRLPSVARPLPERSEKARSWRDSLTEPRVMPAEAAGVPEDTLVTSAPELTLSPGCCALTESRVCTDTPRKPTIP